MSSQTFVTLLQVVAIFDNAQGWIAKTASANGVKVVGDEITSCVKEGASVMMRKDNKLDAWWNPAFETLKKSQAQWRGICNDLLDEHGKLKLYPYTAAYYRTFDEFRFLHYDLTSRHYRISKRNNIAAFQHLNQRISETRYFE